MAEVHEQVARLAAAAEKLLRETERLRRDVARLHQRIERFEGEPRIPEPTPDRLVIRNLADALHVIELAGRSIQACEGRVGHLEALMKGIASDALSRSEMKPWLKDRPRGWFA